MFGKQTMRRTMNSNPEPESLRESDDVVSLDLATPPSMAGCIGLWHSLGQHRWCRQHRAAWATANLS